MAGVETDTDQSGFQGGTVEDNLAREVLDPGAVREEDGEVACLAQGQQPQVVPKAAGECQKESEGIQSFFAVAFVHEGERFQFAKIRFFFDSV